MKGFIIGGAILFVLALAYSLCRIAAISDYMMQSREDEAMHDDAELLEQIHMPSGRE
jgi:hypothetical protein